MRLDPRHTQDDVEACEERAALMEYLGCLPRKMAERLAVDLTNKAIACRAASVSHESVSLAAHAILDRPVR